MHSFIQQHFLSAYQVTNAVRFQNTKPNRRFSKQMSRGDRQLKSLELYSLILRITEETQHAKDIHWKALNSD